MFELTFNIEVPNWDDFTFYWEAGKTGSPEGLGRRVGSTGASYWDDANAPDFDNEESREIFTTGIGKDSRSADLASAATYSIRRVARQRRTTGDCLVRVSEQFQKKRLIYLGRGAVCKCFQGLYWSVTLRRQSFSKGVPFIGHDSYRGSPLLPTGGAPTKQNFEYWYDVGSLNPGDRFFNTRDQISTLVFDEVFRDPAQLRTPPGGLIVVAGATGSAKSTIVRHLIHLFLQGHLENRDVQKSQSNGTAASRRPHLITFEDPIEKYLASHRSTPLSPAVIAKRFGIDYTPRQRRVDVESLEAALQDALRQTPTVFFAGETRDPDDWTRLLEFAGSGHLVFTTSHAGGLVEAMSRILRATAARTAEVRSEVANRLLAVVHLKKHTFSDGTSATVPALWRHTPIGAKALISEGLSSILPHNAREDDKGKSGLGRQFFSKKLISERRRSLGIKDKSSSIETELLQSALGWDLEGV